MYSKAELITRLRKETNLFPKKAYQKVGGEMGGWGHREREAIEEIDFLFLCHINAVLKLQKIRDVASD